jgi:hypothetical protein
MVKSKSFVSFLFPDLHGSNNLQYSSRLMIFQHSFTCLCRSSFTTFSPVLLQEQSTVVLLLERALISWSLAIDERDEHKNLHGLDHRSVIPYIHGMTGLYCSNLHYLYEPELFSFDRPLSPPL